MDLFLGGVDGDGREGRISRYLAERREGGKKYQQKRKRLSFSIGHRLAPGRVWAPAYSSGMGCQIGPEIPQDCKLSGGVGEGCVFRRVVELLGIERGRRVWLLPGDGPADGLFDADRFAVTQLFSNTVRRNDHVLMGIAWLQQMLGRALPRQRHEFPRPLQVPRDGRLPCEFR